MAKPICAVHMVEMVVKQNGVRVDFPLAQYIYMGDLWGCPLGECEIIIRAEMPFLYGEMDSSYQYYKQDVTHRMWNV